MMDDIESINVIHKSLENDGILTRIKSEIYSRVLNILLNESKSTAHDSTSPSKELKSENDRIMLACVRDAANIGFVVHSVSL